MSLKNTNKIPKSLNLWSKANKIIPGGTILYLKIQMNTYLMHGQHIISLQKAVLSLILIIIDIGIFQLWGLAPMFLDMEITKLTML